ncbi:MAG: SUF system NifU family Fe-S cluster assembly protein [Actinomycetota bacterium]|jgi:nitrogen fixation NifU-like protein|nr:SUF system NifU family Fe-S cluster assembly protein [Euzebyaceae bacterium]MBA3620169.1 SUF system NifU family Fe-S cluster assembly protein [Acidothermales bacterium]MDQ3452634.1 SUF system NifU family Fe-S cluster assembly protein [Actinomycetota bacterium]
MSSSLDDLYQEIILDHYRKPRHRAAELEPHDVHVHHANPLCGDELDLRLQVDSTGSSAPRVGAVVYDGDGCSISMASASAMTEAVTGRELADADDLGEAFRLMMHGEGLKREDDLLDGVAFQGVAKFPVRVKCALLGWMALKDAIGTYRDGNQEHRVTHE